MKIALGMMSGTSGDGVSMAAAGFKGRTFKLLHEQTFPYPAFFQKEIAKGQGLNAAEISRLNVALGNFFGDCAARFLKKYSVRPVVIGSHGHTIYHGGADNPPNTLQIGEPSCIAEKTGVPVVADFRMADIAAGGQGAPLIPFFDQIFFGSGKPRALQNIGGIGNVTVVGKDLRTFAFDTGPGNCLIDLAVQKMTRGKQLFDRDGKIAAKGKIDEAAVKRALEHPYFKQRPPKSTGRELFNEAFILRYFKNRNPEDQIATLTAFTARCIFEGYQKFFPAKISEIVVSGGGALNRTLMNHLRNLFAPIWVRSIEDFGLPVQAKEPVAFAFFALQAFERKINHSPEGTGARGARILGKIIFREKVKREKVKVQGKGEKVLGQKTFAFSF